MNEAGPVSFHTQAYTKKTSDLNSDYKCVLTTPRQTLKCLKMNNFVLSRDFSEFIKKKQIIETNVLLLNFNEWIMFICTVVSGTILSQSSDSSNFCGLC